MQATKSTPWSGFKRLSKSEQGIEVKKRKGTNDEPHICLKCGAELTRGREYYKKRHWEQAHKDEKEDMYSKMIVGRDHEKARNFLSQKKEQNKMKDAPRSLIAGGKGHVPNELLSQNIKQASTTCDTNDQTCDTSSHQKKGLQGIHTASSEISVQRSLESFFTVEEKEQPDALEKIQSDVNQILVKLGSLTVNESSNISYGVNCDVTTLKTVSNLMEVKHPDICVETLEDGCKITCMACKNYMMSQPKNRVYVFSHHFIYYLVVVTGGSD